MLDYTWSHEGAPNDGAMLIAVRGDVHISWCDSFHMDTKLLELAGGPAAKVIAATGSYSGWRAVGLAIELELMAPDGL